MFSIVVSTFNITFSTQQKEKLLNNLFFKAEAGESEKYFYKGKKIASALWSLYYNTRNITDNAVFSLCLTLKQKGYKSLFTHCASEG